MLTLDAVAFFLGLAFFDGTTVLPVLLARLGAPDSLVGLSRFVQVLGFTLPALFASHYIHGRANHKRFLLATSSVGRAGLLTLPPMLLLFADSRPGLALAWLFVVISLFWLLDGCCAVSWFDIIAKTMPARVRGRFFGSIQTVTGLSAMAAGGVVAYILRPGGISFPQNFALLAACWCIGAAGSSLALFLIREPPGIVDGEERPSFAVYLRQALPLLRRRPRLAQLILIRFLLDGAGLAGPFYVLFARRDLHLPLAMVGVFTILQSVGRIAAGPILGALSDRFGPPAALRAVGLAILAVPALALTSAHAAAWTIGGVFLVMGMVQDGLWMVTSSALLEIVDDRERPLAIGVSSVFQTPASLYGVIGGRLAQLTSYQIVFATASAFAAVGLLLALRFRSTR